MRSTASALAALAVAATTLLTGCNAEDRLGLRLDWSVSEGGPQPPNAPFLIGAIPRCREGRGTSPITVDDVRTLDGDLEVTGFAIRDNPFEANGTMIGDATARWQTT